VVTGFQGPGVARGADAIDSYFSLELGNFAVQALFGRSPNGRRVFKFATRPPCGSRIDDQFADRIHQCGGDVRGAMRTGFCGRPRDRKLRSLLRHCALAQLAFIRSTVRVLRGELRNLEVFIFWWANSAMRPSEGIDLSAHFRFVGRTGDAKSFSERRPRARQRSTTAADAHFSITQAADQVFDAVGDGAQALQSDLRRQPFTV